MILKIIATALTGIGGHFLNRRWDKAFLFFCLFVCYYVFCYIGVAYLDMAISRPGTPAILPFLGNNENLPIIVSRLILAGFAVLVIISIISTLRSKENEAARFVKWTSSGVAAALLMTTLSLFVFFYTMISYISIASGEIIPSSATTAMVSYTPAETGENPESLEKIKGIYENRRKMESAEVLIEAGLLAEAEKLLGLVDSQYAYGRKETLTGTAFALQGNCAKAKEFFEQASKINPQVCIEEKYKNICK